MSLLLVVFSTHGSLRLDQAKIPVLSFVEDTDPAGVGIAEDDKTVGPVREFERRLFGCHRFYVVTPGIDNSHR